MPAGHFRAEVGQFVVDYANANWGGKIDGVLSTIIPEWDPVTMGRFTAGFVDVVHGLDPSITKDSITLVDVKLEFEKAQLAMEAFMNAHPDQHHLVLYAHKRRARPRRAGRRTQARPGSGCLIVSHGADAQVRAELANCDSALKNSLAYFPDKYGEFLLPIVNDVLASKDIPQRTSSICQGRGLPQPEGLLRTANSGD